MILKQCFKDSQAKPCPDFYQYSIAQPIITVLFTFECILISLVLFLNRVISLWRNNVWTFLAYLPSMNVVFLTSWASSYCFLLMKKIIVLKNPFEPFIDLYNIFDISSCCHSCLSMNFRHSNDLVVKKTKIMSVNWHKVLAWA